MTQIRAVLRKDDPAEEAGSPQVWRLAAVTDERAGGSAHTVTQQGN
jgi:hypothetical protein